MLRSEKKMKVQWLLSFVKVVPEINGIHSDSSSCAPRWGGFTFLFFLYKKYVKNKFYFYYLKVARIYKEREMLPKYHGRLKFCLKKKEKQKLHIKDRSQYQSSSLEKKLKYRQFYQI